MSGVWETTGYSGGLSRTEFADGEDQFQYAQNIDTRTDMRTARLSAARENVWSGDAMVIGNGETRFYTASGECRSFSSLALLYDLKVVAPGYNPAVHRTAYVLPYWADIWMSGHGYGPYVAARTYHNNELKYRPGFVTGTLTNGTLQPRAFVPTNSTARVTTRNQMARIVSSSETNGQVTIATTSEGQFSRNLVGLRRYIDSRQLVDEYGYLFGYDSDTKKGIYDAPTQGDARIAVSFNEYFAILRQRSERGVAWSYYPKTGSLWLASGLQQQMLYSYTPNFDKFNFTGLPYRDHVMCANLGMLYIASPEGIYAYGSRSGERNHINLEYTWDNDGIGYVFHREEHLYISYKAGSTYKLDKINTTANNTKYAQTGYIRSNVYDAGNRTVAKSIDRVMISYDKLAPGDTIALYAILDRGTKYHIGTIDHTYHQQRKIREAGNYPWCQQWYDLEYEVVLTSANGTTTPVLRDVLFFWSMSNDPK